MANTSVSLIGLLQTQPQNPNFLSPLNFRFTLARAPHLNFFVVRATLPEINLPSAVQLTPFINVPEPGNKISYGTFSIIYRVDENLNNYLEMHDWMEALGRSENFDGYKKLQSSDHGYPQSVVSDATLTVLDSQKNPRTEITFRDMWPSHLSEVWFNVDAPTVKHVTQLVRFKYSKFTIKQLTY